MQVERLNDEGVKLKTLQTSLTLMQMPELAQDEVEADYEQKDAITAFALCVRVGWTKQLLKLISSSLIPPYSKSYILQEAVAAVLGICFRILADPKNSDSVLSTAIATARQVLLHILQKTVILSALSATILGKSIRVLISDLRWHFIHHDFLLQESIASRIRKGRLCWLTQVKKLFTSLFASCRR